MVLSEIKKSVYYVALKTKYTVMNAAEYRADFLAGLLGTFSYMIMVIIFISFLLAEFGEIAGWDKFEVLLLFVTGQFIFYTFFSFFFYLASHFSRDILSGNIDKFITKPVNTLVVASVQQIHLLDSIPSIIFVLVLFKIIVNNLPPIDFANYIFYAISTVISFLIYYLVALSIALLTFWINDTNGLSMLFLKGFGEFIRYPATIFPTFVRIFFFTLIPIALLAYAPSYFLVKGFSIELFTIQIITLLMFIGIARFLWVEGFKVYSSASS